MTLLSELEDNKARLEAEHNRLNALGTAAIQGATAPAPSADTPYRPKPETPNVQVSPGETFVSPQATAPSISRQFGSDASQFIQSGNRDLTIQPGGTMTNFPTARDVYTPATGKQEQIGPAEKDMIDKTNAAKLMESVQAEKLKQINRYGIVKAKATASVQAEFLKNKNFLEQAAETKQLMAPPGKRYELASGRNGPKFRLVSKDKDPAITAPAIEPLQILGSIPQVEVAPTNMPTVNNFGREIRDALLETPPANKDEMAALIKAQSSFSETLAGAQSQKAAEELKKSNPKLYADMLLDQVLDEKIGLATKTALKTAAATNWSQAQSWLAGQGKSGSFTSLQDFETNDPDLWQEYIIEAPKAYLANISAKGDPELSEYFRIPGEPTPTTIAGSNLPDSFDSALGGMVYRDKDGLSVTFDDELARAKSLLPAVNAPIPARFRSDPVKMEAARRSRETAKAKYDAVIQPLLNAAMENTKNLDRIDKIGGPNDDAMQRSVSGDIKAEDKRILKKYGPADGAVIIAKSQDIPDDEAAARIAKGVPGLVESTAESDGEEMVRLGVTMDQMAGDVLSYMQSGSADGKAIPLEEAITFVLSSQAGENVTAFGKNAGASVVTDLAKAVSAEIDTRFGEITGRNTERIRKQNAGLLGKIEQASAPDKIDAKGDMNIFTPMLKDGSFNLENSMDQNPEPSLEEFALASGKKKFGNEYDALFRTILSGDDGSLYDVPQVNKLRQALLSMGSQVKAEWTNRALAEAKEEEAYQLKREREKAVKELLPAEKEKEREVINSENTKKGLLTAFVDNPLESTVAGTFRNDDAGRLEKRQYDSASTDAERKQVLSNGKKRLAKYDSTVAQAEQELSNLKNGRITKRELVSAEVTIDGESTGEYKGLFVHKPFVPESDEDWQEVLEKASSEYGMYSDLRDTMVQSISEARNKWNDDQIARSVGYTLEQLPRSSKVIVEIIRKLNIEKPAYVRVDSAEAKDLWAKLEQSLPDEKAKDALAEDYISKLPLVTDPNIPLTQILLDKKQVRDDESIPVLSPEEASRLPPGTAYETTDGRIFRR